MFARRGYINVNIIRSQRRIFFLLFTALAEQFKQFIQYTSTTGGIMFFGDILFQGLVGDRSRFKNGVPGEY